MIPASRILVAGRRTLIGAALVARLRPGREGVLVGADRPEPDWTDARQVEDYIAECRADHVFLAAGLSGGIGQNQARPAELMRDNLLTATHVIEAAHQQRVRKLFYLASSCGYPREAAQPLRTETLLTGPIEPTSAPYALAKLAGWQLCLAYRRQYGANFITGIPANAFGPHDDFSASGGHVIPALMRRMHEAKVAGDDELTVWGTGKPRREFLFAADLADACVFVMQHYGAAEPINLGGGIELTIAEVARTLADVIGYSGRLRFDASKPDGAPRKCLDSTALRALGWEPATNFHSALEQTYQWFLHHVIKEETVDEPATV